MIRAVKGGAPENVLQAARHVLFVEGAPGDSFDVRALSALLDSPITIKPLGPSYYVKSVAEALHPHHPDYYFLIDRDPHHTDEEVETSWVNFPDANTHNLLIWRRREIENYFLDPQYLARSEYCKATAPDMESALLEFAQARLYFDAANWVITAVRESQKRNWITTFKSPGGFDSYDSALERLKARPEFAKRSSDIESSVSAAEVERRFEEAVCKMTGGAKRLELGQGDWIAMLRGKKLLAQLVNSNFFEVRTKSGQALQGWDKINEVVKDLLRQDKSIQPPDFPELNTLIANRVGAAR